MMSEYCKNKKLTRLAHKSWIRSSPANAWYLDGELHREDGPAVEMYNGTKIWYRNGELHREDGPAIEFDNGIKKWFLDGDEIEYSDHEEFLRIVKTRAIS